MFYSKKRKSVSSTVLDQFLNIISVFDQVKGFNDNEKAKLAVYTSNMQFWTP